MSHTFILKEIDYPISSFKTLKIESLELTPEPSLLIVSQPENGLSQFLKILAGIIIPDNGCVDIDMINLRLCTDNVCKVLKGNVSFGFQHGTLISNLTIRENILLPVNYHFSDISKDDRIKLVHDKICLYDLEKVLDLRPSELTYMQRKTVSIIRTFITNPDLIIMDEPFQNMQDEYYCIVKKLITDHLDSGNYCVIGTKDPEHYPFIKNHLSIDRYII